MSLTTVPPRLLSRLRTSRIGLRVLAFNLLVLVLPVAGILYLDTYESQLLEAQERGMVEQGRVLAAALGGGALTREAAATTLGHLIVETDSRYRVFGPDGELLADSRRILPSPPDRPASYQASSGRDAFLYKVGAWLVRVRDRVVRLMRRAQQRPVDSAAGEPAMSPELAAALQGRYGASARPTSGQRSLTLHSALPIHSGERVVGAVIVSQSTYRVLQALYGLRLQMFQVVVGSAILAALLSLLMSATIVRPLVRLKRAAMSLTERRTPLAGTFAVVNRADEIGDLAQSLDELAGRLDAHIRLLESVAADVAHEFKNPLAAIRSAAEMLAAAQDERDRQRFYEMLTRDVDRLERMVTGVRELARLDSQLAHEAAVAVDVTAVLRELSEGVAVSGTQVNLAAGNGRALVRASRDGLVQVFENILVNAASLAPGQPIDISVSRQASRWRIEFADRGPGIPEAHLDRVFERFFSYRPQSVGARRDHAGLGLAIAKTIVEGYGGTISARNRDGGGASFTVELPALRRDND
jgi:two-component system sensor histidine kinase ChvG